MPKTSLVKVRRLSMLARAVADFLKYKDDGGLTNTDPPYGVLAELLEHGDWNFPLLRGVGTTPFIRKDFSIATEPGYYGAPDHQLLVRDCEVEWLPVSDRPTMDEITEAVDQLDFLVDGFPFGEKADKANALAALITPALPAHFQIRPVVAVSAPGVGHGKTYLAFLVQGTYMGRVSTKTIDPGMEEFKKSMCSSLLRRVPVLVWDNLNFELNSGEMAMYLTSPSSEFRLLGLNKDAVLENTCFHIIDGVNLRFGDDLADRAVFVRLDAKEEDAGARTGFAYRIPDDVTGSLRPKTIWAVQTLVRAWHVSGGARWRGVMRGNFSEWAGVVGGVMMFGAAYSADMEGWAAFLKNRDAARKQHTGRMSNKAKARAWVRLLLGTGEARCTPSELWDHYALDDDAQAGILDLLPKGFPTNDSAQRSRAIGVAMTELLGQTVDIDDESLIGSFLLDVQVGGAGRRYYFVVPVEGVQ